METHICKGITKEGTHCTRKITKGLYCYQHAPKSVAAKPTKSVAAKPTKSVAAKPTKSVTAKPTKSVAAKPTKKKIGILNIFDGHECDKTKSTKFPNAFDKKTLVDLAKKSLKLDTKEINKLKKEEICFLLNEEKSKKTKSPLREHIGEISDVMAIIMLDADIKSIAAMCTTENPNILKICKNDNFWEAKYKKDNLPFELYSSPKDYIKEYINLTSSATKKADSFIKKMIVNRTYKENMLTVKDWRLAFPQLKLDDSYDNDIFSSNIANVKGQFKILSMDFSPKITVFSEDSFRNGLVKLYRLQPNLKFNLVKL